MVLVGYDSCSDVSLSNSQPHPALIYKILLTSHPIMSHSGWITLIQTHQYWKNKWELIKGWMFKQWSYQLFAANGISECVASVINFDRSLLFDAVFCSIQSLWSAQPQTHRTLFGHHGGLGHLGVCFSKRLSSWRFPDVTQINENTHNKIMCCLQLLLTKFLTFLFIDPTNI